jgi:hypothetical protein
MPQTSHEVRRHAGSNVVFLTQRRTVPVADGLSPAIMARYLRETNPRSARCFALEMQERAGWANETWDAYWADVARLV